MYVKVRVTTGSKKEACEKIGDTFHIAVKERSEQNQANKRIFELLEKLLKIPKKKIHMIKGHRGPSKLFSVDESGILKE